MNKIIFGFVGEIASGKGTACDYLINKYAAGYHRYSTILRDITDRLYLEQSRENLQDLSTILRNRFGQDLFAQVMAKEVEDDPAEIICVDGIRRPDDIIHLKQLPGFILVSIVADMKTRHKRIVERAENTDDQIKTFEEFKKDHENENEKSIRVVAQDAKEKIDNNGSHDKLFEQIDSLVEKYEDKNKQN
ncbi:MAG TPA: AAA family ATPase [Candidatus Bipolaricaulota bacterium]|nr:AAA family ATPase [Candidatus Bipolaricaulota bacterium]